MEKKISLACFVCACTLVALWFYLRFKIIAVAGAFATGYLAFEFHEVLLAIPTAFNNFTEGWRTFRKTLANFFRAVVSIVKKFFAKPHPFYYTSLVILLWVAYHGAIIMVRSQMERDKRIVYNSGDWFLFVAFFVEFWFFAGIYMSCIPAFLTWLGARVWEKSFWGFTTWGYKGGEGRAERETELTGKGLHKQPLSYSNAYRWMLKGLLIVVGFVCAIPFMGIYYLFRGLIVSIIRFIKLIHSNKRLLCATDGTLGGLIAVYFLGHGASAPEIVALMFTGGVIGALLGVANYRYVSQKIFGYN